MTTKTLLENRREMKAISRFLIKNTVPLVSIIEDQSVSVLKQRRLTVDGLDVLAYFTISAFANFEIHTFHVSSVLTPFLPFSLVCKLGRFFLGSKNLSYLEFFNGDRKVYCWTVKMQDGKPVQTTKEVAQGSYEGFEYNVLNPSSVKPY